MSDDLRAAATAVAALAEPVLVVDFDGTLSELVAHPRDAVPVDGAGAALSALAERAAVAVLSGRPLDDLTARLGSIPPRVLLVGGHGSEARAPDGERVPLVDATAAAAPLRELADRLEAELDPASGWQVERKSTSVAVHDRRVPDRERTRLLPWVRRLLEDAAAQPPGFEVLDGKRVVECRLAGVDKGTAVRWVAGQVRAGPSGPSPVVVGDDVTDEDGFAAAGQLGGFGVRVATSPVASAARFRLRDPSRVVTLLRAVRDGLGDDPAVGPVSRWENAAWHDRP